jgi:hypothetical protein
MLLFVLISSTVGAATVAAFRLTNTASQQSYLLGQLTRYLRFWRIVRVVDVSWRGFHILQL